MKYVYFENRKYIILPYSQMFNFNRRLCIKKLDSNCIFFVKCKKDRFLKFVNENKLEFFFNKEDNQELYIKKFRFYEYTIYFIKNFLVMETPIQYRFLSEVGNRYFGIEIYILDAIKEIADCEDHLGYCTELDNEFPFKKEYKETIKCKKKGCNIDIPHNDKFGYCSKHLILKSFKHWLNNRYQNELEWNEEIPIDIH